MVRGKVGSKDALVLLYGFDFAMFAHADLMNLIKLKPLWNKCVPAVLGYGVTKGEGKLAIVLEFSHSMILNTQSPVRLSVKQREKALLCLDELHKHGLINGYIRALDAITNTVNDNVMWMNFGFAVSDLQVYGNLNATRALRSEYTKERMKIVKAITYENVFEIF